MDKITKRKEEKSIVKLVFLPEELINISENATFEELLEHARKVAIFLQGSKVEGKFILGKIFTIIKERLGHGKWLEGCAILGINRNETQRCMKIAEGFERNPNLLEGLTQQKALYIASQPEEMRQAIFDDGLLYDAVGNPHPISEFRVMAWKDFQGERKEYKEKIRDLESRLTNTEAESRDIKQQAADIIEENKRLKKDAPQELIGKCDFLNKQLDNERREKDILKLGLEKQEKEKLEKQDALEILREIRTEAIGIFGKLNQIDFVGDKEVAAEYESVLKFIGEYLTGREVRIRNVVRRISEYKGDIPEELL